MSDIEEFAAQYARHQTALAEATACNKMTVLAALSVGGITRVLADFDGECDTGQIQNIAAYCGEELREVPNVSVEIQRVAGGSGKHDPDITTLRNAIETLCYDYLSQEHGGWENNDGAFGEFTFEVADGRIELEFNGRFSDSTLFSHTF